MKYKLLCFLTISLLFTSTTLGAVYPNILSEGAILIEPHTNTILYEKNIYETFYPASTTKVLTSLILLEDMTNPQEVITRSFESYTNVPSNSSHIGLSVGDTFSYIDGIHAIMMASDNFISYDMGIYNATTTAQFTDKMNEYAKSFGAYNTNFVNAHGYHHPDHYTTPFDLALITKNAFANEQLIQIAGKYQYNFSVLNRNTTIPLTHTAPLFDPNSDHYNPNIVAAKTGFHTPAGRTLVAKAIYDDIELIGVVMKTDSPNQFIDMNILFEYGSNNFKTHYQGDLVYGIENISYSPDAKPDIDGALQIGLIKPSTRHFSSTVSTDEFIFLTEKAVGIIPLSSDYEMVFTSPSLSSSNAITKAEAASIIYSYFNPILLNSYRLSDNILYTDVDGLSKYDLDAIYLLSNIGIFDSSYNTFSPNKELSYEEIITLIYKTHIIANKFPFLLK